MRIKILFLVVLALSGAVLAAFAGPSAKKSDRYGLV
jgi:hypothetical protein